MREDYYEYINEIRGKSDEQKILEKEYFYFKQRQRRARRIASLVTILLGVTIYVMFRFLFESKSLVPSIIGLIFTITGFALYLINYLQTENIGISNSQNMNYRIQLELEELRLDLQKTQKKRRKRRCF